MDGVVFDVNAYRVIVHGLSHQHVDAAAAELRRAEEASGVTVFAAVSVVKELLVHVANPADPASHDCAMSLFLIGLHCSDPLGALRMVPEAGALVSHMLTGDDPFKQEAQQIGAICQRITQARGVVDAESERVAQHVLNAMERREVPFLDDYHAIVTAPLDKNSRRKAISFVEEHAEAQSARALAFTALAANRDMPATDDVDGAAKTLLQHFAPAFALHRRLLRKRIDHEEFFTNESKRNERSNFLWDLHLSFLVGAPVANGRLSFVTGDKQLHESAKESGQEQFVLSLSDYLEKLGATITPS